MIRTKGMKFLSLLLTITITVSSISVNAFAAAPAGEEEDDKTGKYVSDVYFAYGKTEAEAVKYLEENGWEPIKGSNDFNAGKNSTFDDPVAVAMGIKRTSKAENAITDMAVMNMKDGYSFPDYEALVKEKKAEIDEFVNGFIPVIQEYRANYNGDGSQFGKKRAELAHDVLNKFYDGGTEEEYPKNDTGLELGDLLLKETIQEGSAYGGDLQQIILEGNSSVIFLMEQMLSLAADSGPESWIDRLTKLAGDELTENIAKYVPEAEGQNLSASVVMQFLNQNFGDTARILQAQWETVHDDIVWIENFSEKYDLKRKNEETEDAWSARVDKFFEDLEQNDPETYENSFDRYLNTSILYNFLYITPYEGGWGETLGDFFNPAGDAGYADESDTFLPFAAALSNGQRAAVRTVSLYSLLLIGSGNEEGLALVQPEIDNAFDKDTSYSLYFGINRAIFRGGAALTSAAEMAQNMGRGAAYDLLYNNTGVAAIVSYCAAAVGLISVIAGGVMAVKGVDVRPILKAVAVYSIPKDHPLFAKLKDAEDKLDSVQNNPLSTKAEIDAAEYDVQIAEQDVDRYAHWENGGESGEYSSETTSVGYAGRTLLCIGAVLLIGAAVYNGYRFYSYYQKDFTPIPLLIVDEADIVSYTKDENGKEVKNINFDQYAYYEVAKCNRQAVGNIGDRQDGVESYAEWGCGDAVDLNAPSPMLVTPSGISIEVRPEHSRNAL